MSIAGVACGAHGAAVADGAANILAGQGFSHGLLNVTRENRMIWPPTPLAGTRWPKSRRVRWRRLRRGR